MSRPSRHRVALALLTAGALATSGCGGSSSPEVGDATERQIIDETAGSIEGIALKDGARHVVEAFGPAPKWTDRQPLTPRGRDFYEVHGARTLTCPGQGRAPVKETSVMRYELVSFMLLYDRVCSFETIEDGAATRAGVAIGDALSDVQSAFAEAECGTANEGTEYATFRYCAVKLAPERHIWFGGDPIDTIEVSRARPGCAC